MASFLDVFLFILPSYVSNSIPVELGGGAPLDGGWKWGDRRLLGDGKTVRGFLAGVSGGTLTGSLMALLYPSPFFSSPQNQFIASFLLALGTMLGDSIGSFIKRRLGMAPGKPFILDSILFLFIALLLVYPLTSASLYAPVPLAFLIVLTLILHPLFNFLANRLGMKSVPW